MLAKGALLLFSALPALYGAIQPTDLVLCVYIVSMAG